HRRWDAALAPSLSDASQDLWRAHADAINASLLERWLPSARCDRLLKTDLYDEAMGDGLYALMTRRARCVIGIDVAASVVSVAQSRHEGLVAVCADVRHLPFDAGSFDAIISNSTLD